MQLERKQGLSFWLLPMSLICLSAYLLSILLKISYVTAILMHLGVSVVLIVGIIGWLIVTNGE